LEEEEQVEEGSTTETGCYREVTRAASKPQRKVKKGPSKLPTKPIPEAKPATFPEAQRGSGLEDPSDYPPQDSTSRPVQILLSELRRGSATSSAFSKMPDLENLLASVSNDLILSLIAEKVRRNPKFQERKLWVMPSGLAIPLAGSRP
jgi:hypothetical protein